MECLNGTIHADNTAYTLRTFGACPSGHCSLRSQRRICWKRYTQFRLNQEYTNEEVNKLYGTISTI